MIYLDNAASSPVLPCAIEAFIKAPQGNPNSAHIAGQAARKALDSARETISSCMGCLPEEVRFVSCASEAAAWAMKTLEEYCEDISVSPFEHHCVTSYEYDEHYTTGSYDTGIVQMLVSNETGRIFKDVVRSEYDLCFTDATAAAGHLGIDFKNMGVDYLAADALKFGGIPGAGFLIVKKGSPLSWHHEGTPPVKLICAMASALEWNTRNMGINLALAFALNNRMRKVLKTDSGFRLTLPEADVADINRVSPYILSFRFEGVQAQSLVSAASEQGVCISAGSACSTGNLEPSAALLASGLTVEQALETVRVSFSHENTLEEAERAANIILSLASAIRTL